MNSSPSDERELTSWKEIAEYLGVNVRTAQKWESERGLPIRRLPGAGRGRVLVAARELERWKQSGPDKTISAGAAARWRWRPWMMGSTAILLALLMTIANSLLRSRKHIPGGFRVDQGRLVVLDEVGHDLWRKSFRQPLRSHEYIHSGGFEHRRFWTGDLDGDGRPEVLFVKTPSIDDDPSVLICYDELGVEKWRFQPGRTGLSSGRERFSDSYGIFDFEVASLGPKGEREIVISSVNLPDYPDQVVLLSNSGKVLGEYWHSGYLQFVKVLGRDIYLGGISNGHACATLVVLDADHVAGASSETDEYQLRGFPVAHEKARVFFPRSCVNKKYEQYNGLAELLVNQNSIVATVWERRPLSMPQEPCTIYRLTRDLTLQSAEFHDSFRSAHAELRARHELDHDLTKEEEARLADIQVLRW